MMGLMANNINDLDKGALFLSTNEATTMTDIVERLRLRGTDICCEAAEQIERDEEHYRVAMAMSEKHRKLWVEESQKNQSLEAEIERLRAIVCDPAMCGVELSEENDRLITKIERLTAASWSPRQEREP